VEDIVVRPDPPAAPAPRRPSAVNSQSGYSRRGGDDLTIAVWSLGGPMGLTLFASVVQAAAAINNCSTQPGITGNCSGLYGYAVALGVTSAVLISIYLILFTFAREKLWEKSMMYLSAFLFLWWMAGIGATTFTTNTILFSFAGTLYFSTWCAFIFSGFIMHSEWEQFRSALASMKQMEASNRSTFYLLLASLVEAIAAAFACGTADAVAGNPQCSGSEIYALIAGIISMILCLVLLRVDSEKFGGADKFVGVFLALWWAVGMGYLTIAGPFIVAGNGFFATWAAFFASFFVAQNKVFPISPNATNN